jgi:glycosyltransferase involved in cell wall biosynthesis
MTMRGRLSICYAAPGQHLLPSAGPTRNVLNVANALSEWADVTIAFRDIVEPVRSDKYRVIAIEPHTAECTRFGDDNATRGLHPLRHASYCRALWAFSEQHATSYDIVLEKGWRLSGYLLAAFRRRGVPGVLIENNMHLWTQSLTSLPAVARYLLHSAAHQVARRCSQRAAVVVAETEEMKALLVEHRRLSPDRIEVVALGVDRALFQPMDQQSARGALGIRQDPLVMLYVGAMDEYHDLEPVIEALGSIRPPSIELHVVGDGEYRWRCEEMARRADVPARFHGPVPHAAVPQFIAAADVCLAPYRNGACHGGVVPFSTLKIPEYMSCARPVLSVPGGAIERLVEDRVGGFLFPNQTVSWIAFLKTLPSREQFALMGGAARQAVGTLCWQETARRYLQICERLAFD